MREGERSEPTFLCAGRVTHKEGSRITIPCGLVAVLLHKVGATVQVTPCAVHDTQGYSTIKGLSPELGITVGPARMESRHPSRHPAAAGQSQYGRERGREAGKEHSEQAP